MGYKLLKVDAVTRVVRTKGMAGKKITVETDRIKSSIAKKIFWIDKGMSSKKPSK